MRRTDPEVKSDDQVGVGPEAPHRPATVGEQVVAPPRWSPRGGRVVRPSADRGQLDQVGANLRQVEPATFEPPGLPVVVNGAKPKVAMAAKANC